MATKKTTKPVIKDKTFYAVVPEKHPLKSDIELIIFDSIESAFFDAKDSYDADPSKEKFVVYEIKRKGVVNINVDIKLS
jgi:hypothetical protein